MINFSEMTPAHFKELYKIACKAENIKDDVSETAFIGAMLKREGWIVSDGNKIIGCVSLSDYIPGLDIVIHGFIDPDYQRRWLSRTILKIIYTRIFIELELDRVSGYALTGETTAGAKLLEGMGFDLEGVRSRAAIKYGKKYDVELYGMLKEDCRWI